MPSAPTAKASDKVQACKKLTSILQKEYGKSVPKLKRPVLETMLFAVCLEDNPWEKAEAGYELLLRSYFDLNEIRVSSVGELEATLADLKNAEWKGLRIRSILRFVFESTYTFDFEKLSRLTLESAQKRLKKIDYLSPFVANFTLQQVLGSHVVCLDHICHRTAIHLGIVPPESTIEEASEFLRAGVKKSEAFAFTCLLRSMATDPRFAERIELDFEEEGFDVLRVEERLAILKAPRKRKRKKPAATATEKKTTKKKVDEKKKSDAKAPASGKKAAAAKAPAKKKASATKKKAAAKKSAAPAAKKKSAAAKKTASTSKKTASSAGKSASSQKSSAKKTRSKAPIRKKK